MFKIILLSLTFVLIKKNPNNKKSNDPEQEQK